MRKAEIPTPALVVDLDLFEENLRRMQTAVSGAGKSLRPHAKAHKRVEVARRQIDAGAVGVCVATLWEMETFASAGIGVLLTTPVALGKAGRVVELARGAEVAVVVDHLRQVRAYSTAAERAEVRLTVLVDLDIGDHRTGIPCDERAVELALAVDAAPALQFGGLQAYSVSGSHTIGWEERRAHSTRAIERAVSVQRELLARGLDATRLTGGSTGTWDIDVTIPEFTEMQAGSYALMDVAYGRIGGVPFVTAMHLWATVISASQRDRVTVDAGFKAFATDRPFGPEAEGLPGARWQWAGDEHGFVFCDPLPLLEQRIAFVVPHCDPTVNLHQRLYACRGEIVEEVWER